MAVELLCTMLLILLGPVVSKPDVAEGPIETDNDSKNPCPSSELCCGCGQLIVCRTGAQAVPKSCMLPGSEHSRTGTAGLLRNAQVLSACKSTEHNQKLEVFLQVLRCSGALPEACYDAKRGLNVLNFEASKCLSSLITYRKTLRARCGRLR